MKKHSLIYTGILACLFVSLFTKDFVLILFGLGVGAAAGFCIEYTGVKIIRLWSYKEGFPVQTIVRGWGETGAIAVIASQWIAIPGIALLVGLLFPLVVFELPNIRNNGWSYRAPSWLVVIGWVITIFLFQSTAKVIVLLSERGF